MIWASAASAIYCGHGLSSYPTSAILAARLREGGVKILWAGVKMPLRPVPRGRQARSNRGVFSASFLMNRQRSA
jgi:hypothetical protein